MAHELSCSAAVESSQARDQTCVLCIGRQIFIYCTTGKVWVVDFLGNESRKLALFKLHFLRLKKKTVEMQWFYSQSVSLFKKEFKIYMLKKKL